MSYMHAILDWLIRTLCFVGKASSSSGRLTAGSDDDDDEYWVGKFFWKLICWAIFRWYDMFWLLDYLGMG